MRNITLKPNKGELQLPGTNLFTFIGATPCTDWLNGIIETDERGFICTGSDVSIRTKTAKELSKARNLVSLETNLKGFFAVGDVRKGSVKRVASAVGEGSMAVSQIHRYLAELS